MFFLIQLIILHCHFNSVLVDQTPKPETLCTTDSLTDVSTSKNHDLSLKGFGLGLQVSLGRGAVLDFTHATKAGFPKLVLYWGYIGIMEN